MNQPQVDGSVRPIPYISRATLPNEANWSPLELKGGVITCAIKRFRHYLFHVPFQIYTDHGALEQLAKISVNNPHVNDGWSFQQHASILSSNVQAKPTGTLIFFLDYPCRLRSQIPAWHAI